MLFLIKIENGECKQMLRMYKIKKLNLQNLGCFAEWGSIAMRNIYKVMFMEIDKWLLHKV